MKNDQDKLTDAFGMLREDTLHACVDDSRSPKATARPAMYRRVAVLLAACLALTLTAAALLALPLLRSDDPIPPAATSSDSEETPPILSELSWYDEPLVNVQVLAVMPENIQQEELSIENTPAEGASVVLGDDLTSQQVYILFRAEEGETVTAYSHNGMIGQGRFSDSDYDRQFDSWYEQFLYHTAHHMIVRPEGSRELAVDPENPFILWGGNRYYSEYHTMGGVPDEDFIDFIIRDAEGRITGAGSVYLANRKAVENTASRYYDIVGVSRGTVLGSVRFDDPASVTEEQAAAFLESLHEKAEAVRETLFDDLTMNERFILALGAVINTDYADYNNFGMVYGYASGSRYRDVTILSPSGSELDDRTYLLPEDGSWAQVAETTWFCETCGELNERCTHIGFLHRRFKLTDGRIMDIYNDGEGSYPVVVTDETYHPITDEELLAALMPTDSPMVDEVYSAYTGIQAILPGKVTPYSVTHRSLPAFITGETMWDRYAILEVMEGETAKVLRRFFVHENGTFAEISYVHYDCEVCDFTTTDEYEAAGHEHGNVNTVFELTDGGSYTVEDGYANGQAHAPVFTP